MATFSFSQTLREETQNDWAGHSINYRTPTCFAHALDEHVTVVRGLYSFIVLSFLQVKTEENHAGNCYFYAVDLERLTVTVTRFSKKLDLRLLEPRPSRYRGHSHLKAVVIQCDSLSDDK